MNKNTHFLYKCVLLLFFLLPSFDSFAVDVQIAVKNIEEQVEHAYFSNSKPNLPSHYTDLLTRAYREAGDKESIAYAGVEYTEALGLFFSSSPDYDRINYLLSHSLKTLSRSSFEENYAKVLLLKSIYDRRYSYKYMDAYSNLMRADTIFSTTHNYLYLAKTYQQMAILWSELNDADKALMYNEKAENLFAQTQYPQNCYYVRNNSCIIFSQRGDYDKAISQMERDVLIAISQKDTASIFIFYHNIGQNFFLKKDYQQTAFYYNKALDQLEALKGNYDDYYALIYRSLAKLFQVQHNYEEAISMLNSSLQAARRAHLLEMMSAIYHQQYELYGATSQYQLATESMQQYERLKDSIDSKEKEREFQRLKYQSDINNISQRLYIEQQENKIKQSRFYLTLAIETLCLIIFLFVLFLLRHRSKMRKIENEHLQQRIKDEEMEHRLRQITHENEMSEKEREVASTLLLLSEKNKMAKTLENILLPYNDAGNIPSELWTRLQQYFNEESHRQTDWTQFTIHFQKVHPDFFRKLKELGPTLSQNELRFCCYIRIGMRTKEIAEMLSISTSSVTTTRYRIKKQLQPAIGDMSLDDFLRSV